MFFSRIDKPSLSEAEINLLQDIKATESEHKRLVIISDAGRDHDDEVALTIAAGLSKLGLMTIEGIIANLKPAISRARLITGILNTLKLSDIPVGVGSAVNEHSTPQAYEFDASYISEQKKFPEGQLAQAEGISLVVVSRFCAMACAISPKFYDRLAKEASPIGKRLCAARLTFQKIIMRAWQATDNLELGGSVRLCQRSGKEATNSSDE